MLMFMHTLIPCSFVDDLAQHCSALPCTVKYRNEEGTHKRKRIEGYRKYVQHKEDRKSFSINQSPSQVVMFSSSDLRISVYAIDTSS
jgi:hypothetical protein